MAPVLLSMKEIKFVLITLDLCTQTTKGNNNYALNNKSNRKLPFLIGLHQLLCPVANVALG
jgi:hypothetical protein